MSPLQGRKRLGALATDLQGHITYCSDLGLHATFHNFVLYNLAKHNHLLKSRLFHSVQICIISPQPKMYMYTHHRLIAFDPILNFLGISFL